MQKLRRFLIFLLGVSIPFNNIAFAFADRTWSLGLISSALYFISMLSDLPKIPQIVNYGKYVFNVLWFAVLLTITNFFNSNYYGTPVLPMTLFLCCILLFVMLFHNTLDRGNMDRCLNGIAFGSILMSILFLRGVGVEVGDDLRLEMFGENSNELGIYMCIGATVIFNSWILNDNLKFKGFRYLLGILYVPILALLFATGSRVAFLAFIISFFLSIALYRPKSIGRSILIIILLAICCIILSDVFIGTDFVIIQRILQTTEEGNLSGRDVIWRELWPYVTEHLFYGVGQTGYVDIAKEAIGRVSSSNNALYGFSPHNVLIEIVLYTGIWGLLLFVWFWYQNYKCAVKAIRSNSNLLPLLLLVPVAGCILSGQIIMSKWSYIIYAYVIASGQIGGSKRNID